MRDEITGKKLLCVLIDIVLVICGIVWVYNLFTFANGTMDTSMEAEAVTRYQLESLVILIVANVIMVVLFKVRAKIKALMEK
ncbi:MAG: hypothetical protein IJO65_05680 [Lachnospiraceae bacterium]|nr:hypothetical protein [Lachnospiraceae bacterium]